jgi:hypothetical protein
MCTTRLEFFKDFRMFRLRSYQPYLPNMLPNPVSFLVEHVAIEGISTTLKYGWCQFVIGNKIFLSHPAWMFSLRKKGLKVHANEPLLISPLVYFQFSIDWPQAVPLGLGLSGEYIDERNITVVLYGQLRRPIC